MVLRLSHTWTHRQRWLIATGIAVGLVALAALIYGYERYYRGPNESVLFGTWSQGDDDYYRFEPNHNVELWTKWPDGTTDRLVLELQGRWYAGGDFIYLTFPRLPGELSGDPPRRNILIWRIDQITPTELHAHMWQGEPPRIYKRVDLPLPETSNQALQPTAGRLENYKR